MTRRILFSFVLISTLMISCGPSRADMDATTTKIAADESASQTAEAPTITPQPTITPTPMPSPMQILEASIDALMQVESYHFNFEVQMTIKGEGVTLEMPLTMVGDARLPESMEATLSISLLGTTIESKMIGLGETTYVKNPETGDWEITEEIFSPIDPRSLFDIDPIESSSLFLVGKEIIDEIEVFHVTAKIPAETIDGTGNDLKIDYWIGMEDSLPRQVTLEGEIEFIGEEFTSEGVPGVVSIIMTMQLNNFGKTVVIEAPEIVPKIVQVESAFGWMNVYESNLHPFTIQYPSNWETQPTVVGTNAQFISDQGDLLAVVEEDLIALGLGELTLEQYGDLVLTNINTYAPNPEIIERSTFVASNELSGEVLDFTYEGGLLRAKRFYYLHNGSIAFNATYVVQAEMFEELEPLITYSFSTFDIYQLSCDGYFPVVEQPQPLSPILMNQMTPGIDQLEIALWPEYDSEGVLVIYRMHLTPSIDLPAYVVVPIPSEVGEPHAVAWENPQGVLFNAEYERVVQDDWAMIRIKAEGEMTQLEYYSNLVVEEPWRYYEFFWPGGINLSTSAYEVLWPEGAKKLEISPTYDMRLVTTSGVYSSRAKLGPQGATSSFTIRFCYYK